MFRRSLVGLTLAAFVSTGCLSDDPDFRKFLGSKPVDLPPADKLPKGSLEAASRVDSIGGQILAANPDLGVRPMFFTIGVPGLTIFHRGSNDLYVSDGLVAKCKTDGELAAVLCNELGKMAAEAHAQGPIRASDREPPFSHRLGGDVVGGGAGPDQTQLAEQAYWEKKNPRLATRASLPSKDPNELARIYLTNSGYPPDDLFKTAPLVRQAEQNPDIEKQFVNPHGGFAKPNNP